MSTAFTELSAATSDENSSSALFEQQWQIYRKVVDGNLTKQLKVYSHLRRILQEELPGPFSFLSVACGDACESVGALQGTGVTSYRGIDLSGPAIDLAREHVPRLPCVATLEHNDFAEALRQRSEPADVVWLGQSLHHLDGHAKLAVMRDVRRLLADHGLFLLWEPTRFDDESREAWLERCEDRWGACLHILTAEEWSAMADHVRTADFPETVSAWLVMGREAGFGRVSELLQAPFALARVYCFWA